MKLAAGSCSIGAGVGNGVGAGAGADTGVSTDACGTTACDAACEAAACGGKYWLLMWLTSAHATAIKANKITNFYNANKTNTLIDTI